MKLRCLNSKQRSFADYGGRGIRVCERWLTFDNFLADMGERPEGTTLDRFPDKNGNYELGNCRWATRAQQSQNQTTTKLSDEDATEIRRLVSSGHSKASVARRFGVSKTHIARVVNGESWR